MRHISLAVFFAFVLMCNATFPTGGLAELSKLPHLLEHYQLHQSKENQSTSFTEFLIDHYTPSDHQQEHDHSNLPFWGSFLILWFIPFQIVYIEDQYIDKTSTVFTDFYKASIYPHPVLSILQPPRIQE